MLYLIFRTTCFGRFDVIKYIRSQKYSRNVSYRSSFNYGIRFNYTLHNGTYKTKSHANYISARLTGLTDFCGLLYFKSHVEFVPNHRAVTGHP